MLNLSPEGIAETYGFDKVQVAKCKGKNGQFVSCIFNKRVVTAYIDNDDAPLYPIFEHIAKDLNVKQYAN